MWRSSKKPVVVLAVLIAISFAFKPAEKYFEIAKSLDIFATLFKEVNAYYVDEVDPQRLIRTGINGMLESLDPYTDYIPEDELETFRITTTGQYGGIGALIGVINRKTIITHPYKAFPAFKAGLKVGDELVSIDGKSVAGKTTSEVSSMLKGQPRTDVEVRIKRSGSKEDLVFKIKREKISISNITHVDMVDAEVGYIKLDDFTPGASREVQDAVNDLKSRGAKKLIIDLRDNPGGLLHEAVNIVSLFVTKGVEVVSTKGKAEEWNKKYNTLNAPIDTEIPLAVLTSGGSASAAEIVAGALQDYDRAILVGEKTFGKGLVQTTRPLAFNAQLKVTTAKYFIPSGRCIQALDYAHRKADGTVNRFADSTKLEFKTKGGRKVYDGGGLDPDIIVTGDDLLPIAESLLNQGLVFEYASKYCAENPNMPDLQKFRLSEKEYQNFVSWAKEKKFKHVSPLDKSAQDLMAAASREKFYPELQAELNSLKTKIEINRANDFFRFRPEISRLLEEQIAFHYALDEGLARNTLSRDSEVEEARKVLNDPLRFQKILTPKNGLDP